MHKNLGIIKSFFVLMASERLDVSYLTDSNGLFGGYGHTHGFEYALLQSGLLEWSGPLYSFGDNGDLQGGNVAQGGTASSIATASGLGYGNTGDIVCTRFRGNSTMGTAINGAGTYRNGTTKPSAGHLAYMDTTNTGNAAPNDYLYKPAALNGTNWWASHSVGCIISGGAANPLDATGKLRVNAWLGQFGAGNGTDGIESAWFDNGITVSGTTEALLCNGTADTVAKRTTVPIPAGARAGDVEWRCPVGGTGPWLGYYFRPYNENRPVGFSVSTYYSCGSQSTYDVAYWILNSPFTTLQFYLQCLVDGQGLTKRALFVFTMGPNDLTETNKLGGAPAGSASSAGVVKYNMIQAIARLQAAWALLGYQSENLRFLIQCHPPIANPDNQNYTDYRNAAAELAGEYPANIASVDLSLIVSYAELADNSFDPTFNSNGSDVNHLKNKRSYEIVNLAIVNLILNVRATGDATGVSTRFGRGRRK